MTSQRRTAALGVLAATAAAGASRADAVVGGRTAQAGEAPFMAALVTSGDPAKRGLFCGGALVSDDVVITAAHCVRGQRAAGIQVVIGRLRLDRSGGERLAVRAIASAAYDPRTDEHDVALLRLARPATQGRPIALPPAGRRAPGGTPATVFGWGLISRRAALISRRLRAAALVVRSDRRCAELYDGDFHGPAALCASSPDAAPPAAGCEGDSGGPLVVDGRSGRPELAGLVSYGSAACSSPEHPDVFDEIASDRRWILARLRAWR